MTKSHVFYEEVSIKKTQIQGKKPNNKTIFSMIRPDRHENSKSPLSDALTACPMKTKEQEEQ